MMASMSIDVVFVHGFLSSAKVWRSFKELITTDPDLNKFVSVHCFPYGSPVSRLRPDRRIPEMDDIADKLRTYLSTELSGAERVVLVTHSQGGLVVQRFLSRTLARAEGRDLAKIKHIVMYACPNAGSAFFLSLRRSVFFWKNPQERQLRPLDRSVMESQQAVLRAVVNAQGCTDTECRIPIFTYGGANDRIVPPAVAASIFSSNGVIDGDHFSIVRPTDRNASSYQVLRSVLLTLGNLVGPVENSMKPLTAPFSESNAGSLPDRSETHPISVTPPFGRRKDAPLKGQKELIASIMSPSQKSKVHVLAGLGGLGKSRIALEIADRAQEASRRVWWVSVPEVTRCMREVANQLGAPDQQVARAWLGAGSATDLVWRFLNSSTERWLLVFDNADEPHRLGPHDGPVSDGTGWLREPSTDKGMVIVTSRDRSEATWGAWSTVHRVSPLGDEDGASLLIEQTNGIGGTREQARLLSAELGGLPLALRGAADYVRSASKLGGVGIQSFEEYRSALRQRFGSHGTPDQNLNESLGLELVQKVLDLSLELLAQRGMPQVAPFLKTLACLNIAPIPYHLLLNDAMLAESQLFLNPAMAKLRARDLVDALADLGLVELYVLEGLNDARLSYLMSLHPVVHGMLRDDRDVRQRRVAYYGLNVSLLRKATQNVDPDYSESWPIWSVIAPHAIELSRAALTRSSRVNDREVITSALELARLTIRYLIVTGLLGPAHDLTQELISNCASFGCHEGDREILALCHELGRIELERGDPQSAEAELRRVIDERRRILGDDHADTLASAHKLAKAMLDLGRWSEAEPLLRSIVEAENEVRGPEHADTMVVRHSLARAILALERPGEAEDMLRDILEVRRRLWSPVTPETLFVRQTLVRALLEQERKEEAEAEVRSALSEAAAHPDMPRVLSLRHSLAVTLLARGEVRGAVTELRALREDRTRVLGADHPETRRTVLLLVETLEKLGPVTDGSNSDNSGEGL